MKVTICFDDIKIIVPCKTTTTSTMTTTSNHRNVLELSKLTNMKSTSIDNDYSILTTDSLKLDNNNNNNNDLKVSNIIDNAIIRYKKATGKLKYWTVNIIKLQTLDGAVLDPDDYIIDVIEDKEVVINNNLFK